MSSINIRAATVADGAAISRVHYEALKTYHDFYAAALDNPKFVFLVADEGGKVVGFVRYNVVEGKGDKKAAAIGSEAPSGPSLFAPKEHMKGLWERFNEREAEMDACYEKTTNGQRHYFVNHLMVDPSHQRKGIGGQLLRAVTNKADAGGVPSLLVASAEAHGLYLRLGFEVLGVWAIDNGYWSGEVVRHERELGIGGNEGLDERFEGMKEEEAYMVRWPRK
ncbi:hypothetical protein TOPH_08117 [Tolypocladium ophioglossoides CBS 100239]|uniref:N-acetyltransferase domain-containing protein n=1 Tax=Tolypocladium ophioglossoides (strain CBS 100239) TaxID=1163406 RepID=A0A0L0N0E4_TOLOC|nr:hypothetical protein TOPH_08117 [Tolypocladium ophioglossoides CBS 100239]